MVEVINDLLVLGIDFIGFMIIVELWFREFGRGIELIGWKVK